MESKDNKLFSDVFEIVEKDKGGKKFDRGTNKNFKNDYIKIILFY